MGYATHWMTHTRYVPGCAWCQLERDQRCQLERDHPPGLAAWLEDLERRHAEQLAELRGGGPPPVRSFAFTILLPTERPDDDPTDAPGDE